MKIALADMALTLDDRTGAITSLTNRHGKEFIQRGSKQRPLFELRFRDAKAATHRFNSDEAISSEIKRERAGEATVITIRYGRLRNQPITAEVRITCPDRGGLTLWNLAVEHETDLSLEWIDFPDVVVRNELTGPDGDGRLLWPAMEGVLVDDVAIRANSWLPYREPEYPSKGWEGYYPGPLHSQFMCCYGKEGGLYIAAHDEHSNVKYIEYHQHDGGLRLEYRLFPGAVRRGKYRMPYDMALGVFDGDWHDAADIYRRWHAASALPKPPKLAQNPRVPAWLSESPVVVTYPVRGTKDTGDMAPNEFFPYVNALPAVDHFRERLDSPIMALLMHWEGTAPWAPPYVWPPYGGEDALRAFVDAMHQRGNQVGVYCSGIGWTQTSNLVPYSREEQFASEHLERIMCRAPDGSLPNSLICNGDHAQRWGYDMCPSNRFVGDTLCDETAKILAAKIDYIQSFDQNLGGAAYMCYADNHGHPPAPGPWVAKAMHRLLDRMHETVAKSGHKALIGVESAANESYLADLMLNDLRYIIDLQLGTPIGLYSYLYHEYACNFMGNQVMVNRVIDGSESPLNLLQRIAHSFTCGDLLTVVMKGGGRINWDWCTAWDDPEPDQESAETFIRNLNAWRRKRGKAYLYGGRMEKPHPIDHPGFVPMKRMTGGALNMPAILTSRWTSADGAQAQFLTNYNLVPKTVRVAIPEDMAARARVVLDPVGTGEKPLTISGGKAVIAVPALSAAMIEFR